MTIVYYFIIALLGLAIGSFLNALVWRVHEKKSIVHGRSRCPRCKELIAWYDNIPLLSFAVLAGNCRTCKKKISWQYPLVEAVTAVLFVFVFHQESIMSLQLAVLLLLVSVLVFIFVYDAMYKEIHTWSTIYPAAAFFIYALYAGTQPWYAMLIGVGVGAGFFLLQYVVSKGKWIGGGDVRYGVLMGVLLGWQMVLLGLFLAYVIGAVVSLVQILLGKKQFASETPFGTYLVVGTLAALFWGQEMLDWYISFLA